MSYAPALPQSDDAAASKSFWPSAKTLILVGGGLAVIGAAILAFQRIRNNRKTVGDYRYILDQLKASPSQAQALALKQLYEYSRYPKRHLGIRASGALDALLGLLASQPREQIVLLQLSRVLAKYVPFRPL